MTPTPDPERAETRAISAEQLAKVKAEANAFVGAAIPESNETERLFFEQGANWGVRLGFALAQAVPASRAQETAVQDAEVLARAACGLAWPMMTDESRAQSIAAVQRILVLAAPLPPQQDVERCDPGPCWVCTKDVVTPVRVCRQCAALARVPPQPAPQAGSGEPALRVGSLVEMRNNVRVYVIGLDYAPDTTGKPAGWFCGIDVRDESRVEDYRFEWVKRVLIRGLGGEALLTPPPPTPGGRVTCFACGGTGQGDCGRGQCGRCGGDGWTEAPPPGGPTA